MWGERLAMTMEPCWDSGKVGILYQDGVEIQRDNCRNQGHMGRNCVLGVEKMG